MNSRVVESHTPLSESEGQYPLPFIERHRAIRLASEPASDSKTPVVGACDPVPRYLRARLRQLHGTEPRLVAMVPEDLYEYIATRRLQAETHRGLGSESDGDAGAPLAERGAGGAGEALLRSALEDAVAAKASDVHLVPGPTDAAIWLRVDGALILRRRVSRQLAERMSARLKALARGNAAQRRRPQEGRFERAIGGTSYELRLSLLPGMHGESVALRLLGVARGGMRMEELGFGPDTEGFLRRITARRDGLFLVTGPTGSGKTTTLHAMARLIVAGRRRIVTIEDPVEYELPGALQLQTNRALKLDFDVLLTKALRHDPDVLLVGEVRDAETATLAVRAALTGHLVLASMHTATVHTSVLRLMNLGCPESELAAALCGVLSQRLLRRAAGRGAGPPNGVLREAPRPGRLPVAGVMADPADGLLATGGDSTTTLVGRRWCTREIELDARRLVAAGLVDWEEVRRET